VPNKCGRCFGKNEQGYTLITASTEAQDGLRKIGYRMSGGKAGAGDSKHLGS